MAGARVDVRFDEGTLRQAFEALQRAGADLRRPLTEIGEYLVSQTTERFREGRGPDGEPWPQSRRAAEQTKVRDGVLVSGKTLVNFGHLRDSITYRAGPSSVEIGSNLVYAAIHQFGGRAGRGKRLTLPARPFLGINQEDEQEIGRILTDHLAEALR